MLKRTIAIPSESIKKRLGLNSSQFGDKPLSVEDKADYEARMAEQEEEEIT